MRIRGGRHEQTNKHSGLYLSRAHHRDSFPGAYMAGEMAMAGAGVAAPGGRRSHERRAETSASVRANAAVPGGNGAERMQDTSLTLTRFTETRARVQRLHSVQLALMFECDDWKPPQVRAKGETSDPTAARACYFVDELESKLTSLRQEESELLEYIGLTLRIIDGIRHGLGGKYADVLEARYIDCRKWRDIDISRSHGRDLINVACDWVDSLGVSRVLSGNYEL